MAGQPARLENYNLAHVHFVGIGGARQVALASMLLQKGGSRLSGSDLTLSSATNELARQGVAVMQGHAAENIAGATLVVITPAAKADNPEIVAAHAQNIPVIKNAELLGAIANAKRCLAVAGTHGKTTTTSMVAYMLSQAGLDPTYIIGAPSLDLGSPGHVGQGDFAVVEADEYDRTFLQLEPEAAIITNIEPDHLDYYGDVKALHEAFHHFAENIKPEGKLFLCSESDAAVELGLQLKKEWGSSQRLIFYGLGYSAEWRGSDPKPNPQGGHNFVLWHHYERVTNVRLALPGLHNVANAVAAMAICLTVAPQIKPEVFAEVLQTFKGAARRFEVKGDVGGITVVDDYAHHPTEIKATLKAAKTRYPGRRIVALFQPHTYTRTRDLLTEFSTAFEAADVVRLMEIFPARETDTLGVSSENILQLMTHPGKNDRSFAMFEAASEMLKILEEGDIFLTLGAGDVWKVGEKVIEAFESEN